MTALSNYWRSALLLACQEDVVGTYKSPTGADAVLVSKDITWTSDVPQVVRDVMRGYMGSPESIPGDGPATLKFKVELCGSSTADTARPWELLVRLAGFGVSITPGVKRELTPVSDAFISGSLAFYFGGTRRRLRCACVTQMDMDFTVGQIPSATLTVMGIEQGTMDLVSSPTGDFTDWDEVAPIVIMDKNSADIRFDGTYSSSTGVLGGGTAYPSDGMRVSIRNNAKFRPRLGGNSVPITGRDFTGDIRLDMTPEQRADFDARHKGNGLSKLSFGIGNVSGNKLGLWMPSTEITDFTQENDDDLIVDKVGFRARHQGSGNNALRIITM